MTTQVKTQAQQNHLQRIYRLYRSWGHSRVSAYIEARKHLLPPGRMFWFFMLMLNRGVLYDN